ncbi:hypothetical protein [Proteiniphilum sp.]|uniref:hypothetical protein n=1 Tax=Proteiniphilum sp. TaxID=1926877 RepID=UPI002B21F392|nr:hypothetical protein [Proteiniphilum sp.]MEA4918858.1 hypothetical protein [Proteiniphilum sp.]
MAAFFFYNNRKPGKFNYKPVLYNPEEEERKKNLQDRIEKIKREMGVLPEEKKAEKKDFKVEFVSRTHHLKKRKENEGRANRSYFANNGLLIIILLLLFVLFYFWVLR